MSNITVHPDLTTDGPSPSLWGSYDKAELLQPGRSIHIWLPAYEIPAIAAGAQATIYYKGLKGFASTGGTGAVADVRGGGYTLSSDGDDEGASIGMTHYPFQIGQSYGKLWFEASVKTSTISDTKHGFFLGLIDSSTLSATVPIAAAGTLADENFVGFHRLEGDGDKVDTVYKADGVTQVSVDTDAVTLVADTFVKLGMLYDPEDNYKLSFWADGERLPDYKTIPSAAGTDFPNDVGLGFVFAVLNATGSTPGDSTMRWARIAQLLN
jgi:hypothetical protein